MEVSNADSAHHPNYFVEVNNIEKQLWTLIHSKGILHPHVPELYAKATSTYEQIFKSNLPHQQLQQLEFFLWKLHYKHIDEFRKGIKTDDPVTHMKAFKLFLLRASEFYHNLISKLTGYYCTLSEESKSRFLSHRFYICLGDLERYKQQYLTTHQLPDWSTAATYYLDAAKSWPASGNPHNQLAVLATYVGDEFLALYHCVRSLAVKEPFPGAWNNLLLLFEKNKSSPLQSLSTNAQFNFLNPSERNVTVENVREDRNYSKALTAGVDMWPLLVRTISFFFLKSSFDEFGCTFASTMRELDAAFAADDRYLKAMLESYHVMDAARKGPYRIIQLVALFIFIFHNLAEFNGSENAEEEVKLTDLAITMVFIVLGRVVERCSKTTRLDSCPLLPALLVFLEYLPFLLHEAAEEEEEYRFDGKSKIAISYFFGKLVDLLNRLRVKGENKMVVALWEDHELRSLAPLAPIQVDLDFSSHMDLRESFDRGKELRLQRIISSAIEIASREKKGSQKWLYFDKQRTHFYTTSNTGELQSKGELFGEGSVPAEEEEVILLKPLLRCQSAPISSSGNNTTSENQTTSCDESFRRTTSLSVDTNSFSQGLDDMYPHLEEGTTISGRPPSLSAWVVDNNRENGRVGLSKSNGLSPIDETAPITSFDGLSISSSTEHPASLYLPPTPSAPLLPEDASWFHNGACTNKAESFYDQTRFIKPYTNTPFARISSSEWLRRYRESQGTNNLRNFVDRGSSKFSLLARYGTPNEQTMVSSENSTFHPQLCKGNNETRGEKLCIGQESTTNTYGFSDPSSLREKEWLKENGQRLCGSSPAYTNN